MKTRLFAPAVAVALLAVPMAAADTFGSLTSSDGNDVYDWEVRELFDIYIGGNFESAIFAFTQCYGGDNIDNFSDLSNTAILSGGAPGNTTVYGGYHEALSSGLTPGTDSTTAHSVGVEGALQGDSPTLAGSNVNVGGTGSTHVLVWAGDPNELDQQDIDSLEGNFAGNPNTTVTVLSGDGTGANTDGAATMDNLIDAMDDIGSQMGPDEQFIFFVTDHVNLDEAVLDFNFDTGLATITDLDMTAYADMLNDPDNIPTLSILSDDDIGSVLESALGDVTLNGNTVYSGGIDSFFDVFAEISFDFDNDGIPDEYRYTVPIPEEWIQALGNDIELNNLGDTPLTLGVVALNSGAISRLVVPEPTTLALVALGLALTARRHLRMRRP